MESKTLNIVPYYGGKAKLAKYISEMLCTNGISTFIVPFGGGARDLLNAPVYPCEIYNDMNIGMCELIKLLSNKKTGIELINRLYDTEYSEEFFNKCLLYRNEIEDSFTENFINVFKRFLSDVEKQHKQKNDKERLTVQFRKMLKQFYLTGEEPEGGNIVETIVNNNKDVFNDEQKKQLEHFKNEWDMLFKGFKEYREDMISEYSDTTGEISEMYPEQFDKAFDEYKEWYKCKHNMSEEELLEKLKDNSFRNKFQISLENEAKLVENKIYSENSEMYPEQFDKAFDEYKEWYKRKHNMSEKELLENLKDNSFRDEFQKSLKKEAKLVENKIYKELLLNYRVNEPELDEEEQYKLAVATYVTYTQSLNGMGMTFVKNKYKNNEQYHKRIYNLLECMGRLEGVNVTRINAFLYFFNKDYERIIDFMYHIDDDDYLYKHREEYMSDYLKNPNVLIYCDPTYLKQYEEGMEEPKPSSEYNPGKVYKHYWERSQHEIFLKLIRYADCKLLVSNYDDYHHIYDKYLLHDKHLDKDRWHKIEIETTIAVSVGKKGSRRTECLWCNY